MNNEEQNTQWYDGLNLDEESVSTIQNKGWQDANSIIKSYRELEKFSGQDKNDFIKVPKNEDGTFDYSEVYARLGQPEKEEDYEIGDSDFATQARKVLLENHISKSQAQALQTFIDEYAEKTSAEAEAARVEEINAKNEKALADLKTKWGANYDKNVELAKTVVSEFGLTNEQLDTLGDVMGADKVAEMFLRMAKTTDADNKPLSGYNNQTPTKESATARIAELQKDPEFMKKVNEGDPKAIDEMMKLAASTVDPNEIV
jgi:hypothetical protein